MLLNIEGEAVESLGAYLVLGCNGHIESDGFINCFGVTNPVLDLSEVGEDKYERLLQFLENACALFDGPMYNHNKCSNALNMLYRDFGVINEKMLFHIQQFTRMHRACGIYLVLLLKEDYDNG